MTKPVAIFDTEIYRDYFLVQFLNIATGNVTSFELYDDHPLDIDKVRSIISKHTIISFNGLNFDIPILTYALKGATTQQLKECCDYIIVKNMKPWHCESKFGFKISQKLDHIDLFEVAVGKGSLKAYGGKMHSHKIQDLPIRPEDSILPEQRPLMREYCANDLQTTFDLYNQVKPQIELRDQLGKLYGVDLRSKSDAQMAEAVIKHEIEKLTGNKVEKPSGVPDSFRYDVPRFISFESDILKSVLNIIRTAEFVVIDSGKVIIPKDISELNIKLSNSTYKMGIGGLHSTESSVSYKAQDGWVLSDRDVASYYPAIILQNRLYPESLGKQFLKVYKGLVDRRIAAKNSGDKVTADCLKICVNGSFGKFGSKYSILYSPKLLLQTTLTGQLALLMLIEMLELDGISVVSANTDGIVIYFHEKDNEKVNNIVASWEMITGFDTEETHYTAIYMANVNNYIAIKEKGYKLKGSLAPPVPVANSWPSPHNQICVDAILKFLIEGIDIAKTISDCKDIKKFVTTRSVTGGAVKDGEYLGRVVRFYYSLLGFGTINYKVNGNTVPRSEGAMPLMTLPDTLPDDIDYGWYVAEAYKILEEIGA